MKLEELGRAIYLARVQVALDTRSLFKDPKQVSDEFINELIERCFRTGSEDDRLLFAILMELATERGFGYDVEIGKFEKC